MKSKKPIITIGMQMVNDFPLKGKELKQIVENIWVFKLAINDQDKYIAWVELNPIIAGNLNKLLEWSDKHHVVIDKEKIRE